MRKNLYVAIVAMLMITGIFSSSLVTSQTSVTSEWEILEGDTLEIDSYFYGDNGVMTTGPFLQGMTYRMRPSSGTATECDRLYAAGGIGNQFSPYGLYTYSQEDGSSIWNFNSGSQITTKVLVNNFGSETNPADADLRIFFGCENGRLYVLRDGFVETSSNYAPSGNSVWSTMLDGSVVGLIYYDMRGGSTAELRDNPFNNYDLFFATTTNGTIYGFEGPTPQLNPVTHEYNNTQPQLLWTNHLSNAPLTSPTVSQIGDSVFVGSVDGLLYGIDATTGVEIPGWGGAAYRITDEEWYTSPVCVGTPTSVYASAGDGLIHGIWGATGSVKEGWTHTSNGQIKNGYQLADLKGKADGGNLTDISMPPDGSYILVGSDTGCVYSINTNSITVAYVFDTRIGIQDTVVDVVPYFDWRFSRYLFVAATHLNDTATDPSDDFSILFCLASPGNDTLIWRKGFDGVIVAPVISFINNDHVSKADVIITTVKYDSEGTPSGGKMYSYSSSASFIINPDRIDTEATPGFGAMSFIILTALAVIAVRVSNKKHRP